MNVYLLAGASLLTLWLLMVLYNIWAVTRGRNPVRRRIVRSRVVWGCFACGVLLVRAGMYDEKLKKRGPYTYTLPDVPPNPKFKKAVFDMREWAEDAAQDL
jgi:hypothetical protein